MEREREGGKERAFIHDIFITVCMFMFIMQVCLLFECTLQCLCVVVAK